MVSVKKNKAKAVIGLSAGLINGLFGAGGGALVVPASRRFLKMDVHEAHAGAVAVMLPMTVVSAAIYAARTRPSYVSALLVSAGGVLGGVIGARLMKRLKPKTLRRLFAVFIIAMAVKMVL